MEFHVGGLYRMARVDKSMKDDDELMKILNHGLNMVNASDHRNTWAGVPYWREIDGFSIVKMQDEGVYHISSNAVSADVILTGYGNFANEANYKGREKRTELLRKIFWN